LVALARVDALWRADGIILATPSYHGSVLGLYQERARP